MLKDNLVHEPEEPEKRSVSLAKKFGFKIEVLADGHHWRFDKLESGKSGQGFAHFWPASRLVRYFNGGSEDLLHKSTKAAVEHILLKMQTWNHSIAPKRKPNPPAGPKRVVQTARALFIVAAGRLLADAGAVGEDLTGKCLKVAERFERTVDEGEVMSGLAVLEEKAMYRSSNFKSSGGLGDITEI